MRNLAEKWSIAPDWRSAVLAVPGLTIRPVLGLEQQMVSGDLAAWGKASGNAGPGVGAFAAAQGESYTARLARDRLLAVSRSAPPAATGWHAEGFAVTVVSAAMQVFEAEGPVLNELIARATTLDPKQPSASAALSFAGISAIVYRHGEALRIHVDRGLAAYLWTWLEMTARQIAANQK